MIKVCVPVPEGDKGTGLKATVEIPKGSVIGPYVGKAKCQSQGSYVMSYGQGVYVDASERGNNT